MVQGIPGTGHKVEAFLRPVGDHIPYFVADAGAMLPGNGDHAFGQVHARRADALSGQNFAQNPRTAAQIQGRFRPNVPVFHPPQQPFSENFRVIIPSKHIVYPAKHITIHTAPSTAPLEETLIKSTLRIS